MVSSMTAFARQEKKGDWGSLAWQIRSVNHRHLDLSINLPESFLSIETQVREKIRSALGRGKIDATLYFQNASTTNSLTINTHLLEQVLQSCQHIANHWQKPVTLNPIEVLRWSGILEASATDNHYDAQTIILELLTDTLQELKTARLREGQALKMILMQRLTAVREELNQVKEHLPEVQHSQRKRLSQRFEEAKVNLDPQRLEQEMVLFAQRIDIAEECDRLDAHITEVQRLLSDQQNSGRRLDFLMQEMHREANTLGAKSLDSKLSHAAIEMKLLIEQMREQIQNIE